MAQVSKLSISYVILAGRISSLVLCKLTDQVTQARAYISFCLPCSCRARGEPQTAQRRKQALQSSWRRWGRNHRTREEGLEERVSPGGVAAYPL